MSHIQNESALPDNLFEGMSHSCIKDEILVILSPIYSGTTSFSSLDEDSREAIESLYYHHRDLFLEVFNSAPTEDFKLGLITTGQCEIDSIIFPALYAEDTDAIRDILCLAESLSPENHEKFLLCRAANDLEDYGNCFEYAATNGKIQSLKVLLDSAERLKSRKPDFSLSECSTNHIELWIENMVERTKVVSEILRRAKQLLPQELAVA